MSCAGWYEGQREESDLVPVLREASQGVGRRWKHIIMLARFSALRFVPGPMLTCLCSELSKLSLGEPMFFRTEGHITNYY